MAPGARGIDVKVDKRAPEAVDVGKAHREDGDVSLHLRDQKTSRTQRPQHTHKDQKKYRTIVDADKTEGRDPARDARLFDPSKMGKLEFKPTENEALTGEIKGESTRVDKGEGARAAVVLAEAPVDASTIYRANRLLSFYSYEWGNVVSVSAWNHNDARTRLMDLANSPFVDLPIVRDAKATLEALERLRQDPNDPISTDQVDSWYRRYDSDPTGINTQHDQAKEDWEAANQTVTDFRFVVEEPLMTEVPVYWEGISMPARLVELRQSGEILGVNTFQPNPIDIAAARMDGQSSIPALEMTVWTHQWGDIGSIQNEVMLSVSDAYSFSPMESDFGNMMSNEGRLVFTMNGFPDLRIVVNVKRAPSVLVDTQ